MRAGAAFAPPSCNAATQAAASGFSPSALRAERISGGAPFPVPVTRRATGAAPRKAVALVPPKPKLFTPITASEASPNGVAALATARFSAAKSISGLSVAQCNVAGRLRVSSASIALSSPAMPDPASRWPRFDFTEPIGSGCVRWMPMTRPIACASAGSPTRVPVPCASKAATRSGSIPPRAMTRLSSAICAAGLGSESPMVRPAAFTPVPRMVARTASPSASASRRRLTMITPAPSART